MKIMEAAEIGDNIMNEGAEVYLYDKDKYPADYPSVGLYFKDGLINGGKDLNDITYAPMLEYDVEGYRTWGQGAVNKIMTGMDFIFRHGSGGPARFVSFSARGKRGSYLSRCPISLLKLRVIINIAMEDGRPSTD